MTGTQLPYAGQGGGARGVSLACWHDLLDVAGGSSGPTRPPRHPSHKDHHHYPIPGARGTQAARAPFSPRMASCRRGAFIGGTRLPLAVWGALGPWCDLPGRCLARAGSARAVPGRRSPPLATTVSGHVARCLHHRHVCDVTAEP
ncbi:hypothetical protein E2C01_069419 [Portunus trituberculatus]|uniref:Uncharacterized protein n=1 Tax=Portunus trituberculatus TaxID=210409 RepID=A0A5B7I2R5_PORTR|nr:hypothetical protein [Portunus trituberculatus]